MGHPETKVSGTFVFRCLGNLLLTARVKGATCPHRLAQAPVVRFGCIYLSIKTVPGRLNLPANIMPDSRFQVPSSRLLASTRVRKTVSVAVYSEHLKRAFRTGVMGLEKRMATGIGFMRPMIMGVVNVTPDSFSDGGRFSTAGGIDHQACIEQGLSLVQQGAGILDIGGEASSFHRPGVVPVGADQQIHRVVPVIKGLAMRLGELGKADPAVIISVDTRCSAVAQAAISAGAGMINDTSAGEHDPEMFALAARTGCFVVLMHMWMESPQHPPVARENICAEVFGYLQQRAKAAMAKGVAQDRILLDPGLGFGKALEDNWRLVAHIDQLAGQGFPVVLGASRKRFLSAVIADGAPGTWDQRDMATALVSSLAAQRGVLVHRVHNVALAAMALAAHARCTGVQ